MALDIERLRNVVAHYYSIPPSQKPRYDECARQATSQLTEALPALCESDLAAVSYYIASILSSLRGLSIRDASDVVTDTAIGYSLGAAKLLGMVEGENA